MRNSTGILILLLSLISLNVLAASGGELADAPPTPNEIVSDVQDDFGVESSNYTEVIESEDGFAEVDGPKFTVEIGELLQPNFAGTGACPAIHDSRASYYGTRQDGFGYQKGKLITANGERYRPNEISAAHRTWQFGLRVRVTNLINGKSVIVRINDRGPYARDRRTKGYSRNIDLSYGAAVEIGATGAGVVPVRLEPLC